MRVALGTLVVALSLAPAVAVVAPASAAPTSGTGSSGAPGGACGTAPSPYAGVPGAELTRRTYSSKDATPVQYAIWSGFVPSFDGTLLSVDVTVPCHDGSGAIATAPLPAVTILHGFTDDKTVWEETGKSDTVDSKGRPGPNSHWNNIWFASRGYAVLTYTARGWHDSCGPEAPGSVNGLPAPRCAGHQGWIHLDDKRWEVRDAQWLTAGLVAGGLADPHRLAITGGSYGGAPAASAALLAGSTMCGGAPIPAALGADPCAGKANGSLVPWATADGRTRLSWAAALPLYTFADLLQVLAPNGRGADGWREAPLDGSHTQPFGVPLESTVSGLLLAARTFGRVAEPGGDPDSDIVTTSNRLLSGDPFPTSDEEVARSIQVYERFKSPVSTPPQGNVPIFWVQGFTDALFPGSEALTILRHVREADPSYPIKVFFGDLGHDYAAERLDDWKLAHTQMNAFLDHYLRPDRTPAEPVFDVGASVTRCLSPSAPQTYLHAATWNDLHPGTATFASGKQGKTSTAKAGPAGIATDPISTATLPGPKSYKGCRVMRPSKPDPTAATYEFAIRQSVVLLGGPVVSLRFDTTGADTPLAVRVWDVSADRKVQALVTRGVYRVDLTPGTDRSIRFQLAPQAYRLPRGHHLKVEVTANDSPYYRANNQAAEVTVHELSIALPTHEVPASPRPTVPAVAAPAGGSSATGTLAVLCVLALALVGGGWAVARRRGRSGDAGTGDAG